MVGEEITKTEPRIQVEYTEDNHHRLIRTFHLTDQSGKDIFLTQKDAVKISRAIFKIAKGGKVK